MRNPVRSRKAIENLGSIYCHTKRIPDIIMFAVGGRDLEWHEWFRVQELFERFNDGFSHADSPSRKGIGTRLYQFLGTFYFTNSSAIWTALSAAPLRSWSPATNMQKLLPEGSLTSVRIRPHKISPCPEASLGMGM